MLNGRGHKQCIISADRKQSNLDRIPASSGGICTVHCTRMNCIYSRARVNTCFRRMTYKTIYLTYKKKPIRKTVKRLRISISLVPNFRRETVSSSHKKGSVFRVHDTPRQHLQLIPVISEAALNPQTGKNRTK